MNLVNLSSVSKADENFNSGILPHKLMHCFKSHTVISIIFVITQSSSSTLNILLGL